MDDVGSFMLLAMLFNMVNIENNDDITNPENDDDISNLIPARRSRRSYVTHSYTKMFFMILWNLFHYLSDQIFDHPLPRACWKYPRQVLFWDGIHKGIRMEDRVAQQEQYKCFYRMSYNTFHELRSQVEPFLPSFHTSNYIRKPLTSDMALAIVLYRLAHGPSSTLVSELFGVGESTVRKYTVVVVQILTDPKKLFGRHIFVPEGDRLEEIMKEFREITSVPQLAGALDGTHIKLQHKPKAKYFPAQFMCKHKFPSILLQGICDSKKQFWNVACDAPGGQHDSMHFKRSAIYTQLMQKEVLATPISHIQGEDVRPCIIADSAYRLTSFIIKPFNAKGGQHMQMKKEFDIHLGKGRVKIENAFGILKGRWRILQDLNVELPFAPKVVVACCVLHNYVQKKGEVEPGMQEDPHQNSEGVHTGDENVESDIGSRSRGALFRDFSLRHLP